MSLFLSLVAQAAATLPIPPQPRAPLQTYVSPDDFPAGLPRSAARPVGVTLIVGPDGRVTQCRVTASSAERQLDDATCRLLRSRARFVPARDGTGAAISGEVRATLDWTAIGKAGATAAAAGERRITLAPWESISRLRARYGQISFCSWEPAGVPLPPPPASSNACENAGLARMALGIAAENRMIVDRDVVVTLRMTGVGVPPSSASPAALIDLAAELEVDAGGRLTGCRPLREQVRSAAAGRPDCRQIFAGPYVPATDRSGKPVAVRKLAELRVEAR